MRLWIVSDLHIQSDQDPLYRSFLAWLVRPELNESGVRIVLAGDVFDLFVGKKPLFVRRYSEFFDRLRALGSRGVTVDYIEGNHDFWISEAFGDMPGVTVRPSEVDFELGGRRFHVSHGDLVDRTDRNYLRLRAFFRSRLMHGLVKAAPGELLDRIGRSMSRASSARTPRLITALSRESQDRLRSAYHEFAREKIAAGYDFVVCGHCHDLDEAWLRVGSREGQYINVGLPRTHGSVLTWAPGASSISRQALV